MFEYYIHTTSGYTGHEHIPNFGLINMNGRVYDPDLGRFLSPDPYVQMPDFSQNFNRYSYVLNNPLKYTDPTGEFAWFVWAGAALVGGIINLASNWDNVDGFADGLSTFAVGAGAAVGVLATGGSSAAAVMGAGMAGGAIVGTNNSIVAQTGENFSGIGRVDWGQVGASATVGAVAGGAGAGAGYWASGSSFVVNGISSPVLRSVVVSPIASAAGHVAGGTTANLIAGQSMGDAFSNSFDGIGKSIAIGTAIGVTATVAASYASGVNPISGRMMWPKNAGFQGEPQYDILKSGTLIDRYGSDEGFYAAPQGTSFGERSLPPNYINKEFNIYKVVQPIPVLKGTTAPSIWFNSQGGGIQYQLPIRYYLDKGYIIRY